MCLNLSYHSIKTWTEEIGKDQVGNIISVDSSKDKTDGDFAKQSGNFKIDIKDVGGILSLDKGVSLDFSKIGNDFALKGVNTVDLGIAGVNKLENLTLSDVLKMTNDSGELTIKGSNEDKVSFANSNNWTKSTTANSGYYEYTNTSDPSVKVKVQEQIDQII